MPALTPPQDGDANRGPALLAIIGTQVAISTICVSLRFYTRIKIGRVGADDWTIMVTLAMYITLLPLCIVQVHYGLGRHIYYITAVHQIEMMKLTWIMQLINSLNLPIGRVSVVLLLERLMGRTTTWRRLFLWVNMTLFTASMIASSILSVAQCSPPRALWSEVPEAVCLDLSIHANFATFACAYSSFLDFVLALTPITFVRKLEMSIHKKIGICILLGMGMLSGICAAIKTDAIHAILYKTTQLSKLRADLPWEFFSTYAWSSTEVFLNIVCACIPTLKPLYEYFVNSRHLHHNEDSSHVGYRGSSGSPSRGFQMLKIPKMCTNRSAIQTLASVQSDEPRPQSDGQPANCTMHQHFSIYRGVGVAD